MTNKVLTPLISIFTLALGIASEAWALQVSPGSITDEEGTSFSITLTIEEGDWVDVTGSVAPGNCYPEFEYEFQWGFTLQDGSGPAGAQWGPDLNFAAPPNNPNPAPPPSSAGDFLCSNGRDVQQFTAGTVNLLEDGVQESIAEEATLVIDYCVDGNFGFGPIEGSTPPPAFECGLFESLKVTIEADPPLPAVASAAGVFNAAEPDRDGQFSISLDTPAPEGGLTVNYGILGTATGGVDYVLPSGSVFIPQGGTSAVVDIEVIDDSIMEPTETVILTLSPGTGYTVGNGSATIGIEDDDNNTVAISATGNAAEPAMNGSFSVTLTPAPESAVTVNYTVSGTATAGQDYQALAGSVTIPGGSSSATIDVNVIDDEIVEMTETVIVQIIAPTDYTVSGQGVATVSITDDDMAGFLVNPTAGLVVDEGGTTDSFTVRLTSEPTANVTVAVQSSNTSEGTVSPTSLTFTPGNWDEAQTVTVTGVFDGVDDGETPFIVMLLPAQSGDSNYAGLDPQDVSVTNTGGVPGMVQFVMESYSVAESAGTASIDIERVGGDTGELTAEFTTADSGSDNAATAGADYETTTATLTWANGEMGTRTVQIPIFEDNDIPVVVEDGNVIEDVLLRLSRNEEELDTAELLIESNVTEDVEGFITDDSQTPNQREIARVIADTCPQGNNEPDFQDLCTAIVQAAIGDQPINAALQGATPDDAAAVRTSGMQTSNVQMSAIDGRIGTIRGGGGAGFSASGFGVGYGDVTLTGNLVRDFIASFDHNVPEFMQANVGQTDDSDFVDEFGRWGVWITGRLVFGEKDLTSNQIDYDFDTAGLTGGIDYRFTDQFVGGLALGYANTDAEIGANGGDLDTTGHTISLYGNWFNEDNFYISGSVGWGSNDYEQTRNVQYTINQPGFSGLPGEAFNVDQTMAADYDGSQLSASLMGGWDFNKNGLTFGPRLGANYVEVDVDAYDERLIMSNQANASTGWAVHIDDQTYESLEVFLGFELSKAISQSWGVLIPQGYVDVVSELEDGPRPVTGQFLGDLNNVSFTLMTDDFEETFVRAGVGLGFIMKNNKSAFIMIDGDFGRDLLQTYYVNAGFRWQF